MRIVWINSCTVSTSIGNGAIYNSEAQFSQDETGYCPVDKSDFYQLLIFTISKQQEYVDGVI